MSWMNEYDVAEAVDRAERHNLPNALHAACVLARLVEWTNDNSDGWPYWSKPSNAARQLQDLLQGIDRFDPVDLDPADVAKAKRPVKAFFTRLNVNPAIAANILAVGGRA